MSEQVTRVLYLTGSNGAIEHPAIRFSSREFAQESEIATVVSPMWLSSGENARAMVEGALKKSQGQQWDAVVAGASTVSIEESGPLTMTNPTGTADGQHKQKVASCLMGNGFKPVLGGELSVGAAVYLPPQRQGLMTEIKIPFTFAAFQSMQEVFEYFKNVGQLSILQGQIILAKLKANEYRLNDKIAGSLGNLVRYGSPFEMQESEVDDVTAIEAGIEVSRLFPGGIYFPALIRMGKLLTQGGKKLEEMSDVEVGRLIFLTLEDTSRLNNVLIAIAHGEAIRKEVVYTSGEWVKLFLEGRRSAYSFHEFLRFEKEQLQRPVEEIWRDESLPPKIKRKLVLQRLGIEMVPHIFIPKDIFFRDGAQIIHELSAIWQRNIGASSSFFNEPPLSRTPSFRFERGIPHEAMGPKVKEYLEKLNGFTRAKTDLRDFIELYPIVWDDAGRVVGGASRFDTRPQHGGDQTRSNWVIEMQLNTWPRSLDPAKGEYILLHHAPLLHIDGELWEVVDASGRIYRRQLHVTGESHLLSIAEIEALRFTQSFPVREAIRKIMDLRGSEAAVGLEWRYHEADGKVLAIDLSGSLI